MSASGDESDTDGSSSGGGTVAFVPWLLQQMENSWLVEVDTPYIEDGFNLYGLRSMPMFSIALRTLLGQIPAGGSSSRVVHKPGLGEEMGRVEGPVRVLG